MKKTNSYANKRIRPVDFFILLLIVGCGTFVFLFVKINLDNDALKATIIQQNQLLNDTKKRDSIFTANNKNYAKTIEKYTKGTSVKIGNKQYGFFELLDLYNKIEIENAQLKDTLSFFSETNNIFIDGKLRAGLDMGVNTSNEVTNWVQVTNNEITMKYPSGQFWGTVFITEGRASRLERKSQNYSQYTKLIIELKGDIGASVSIGLKDKISPDDGTEPRHTIHISQKGWNIYEINLKDFPGIDLKRLYVVTEFVFENKPETLSVRKIQFAQ